MQATMPFALGRIAFGAGLLAAPERVAAGWLPGDAARAGTKVAVRGLGARDVALAAGVVLAARKRPWLIACLACDLADIAATRRRRRGAARALAVQRAAGVRRARRGGGGGGGAAWRAPPPSLYWC